MEQFQFLPGGGCCQAAGRTARTASAYRSGDSPEILCPKHICVYRYSVPSLMHNILGSRTGRTVVQRTSVSAHPQEVRIRCVLGLCRSCEKRARVNPMGMRPGAHQTKPAGSMFRHIARWIGDMCLINPDNISYEKKPTRMFCHP